LTIPMRHQSIAVVGAGLAGTTLTERLLEVGYQVTVYEKSRGTGGRQASSGLSEAIVDLGAPWFEPLSDKFRNWLEDRPEIQRFSPSHRDFTGLELDPISVYLAAPKQTTLTRNLLGSAVFCSSTRVGKLHPGSEGVAVESDAGQLLNTHQAVIVTTPAPQAEPLLATIPRFAEVARSAESIPTWVVALGLRQKTKKSVDLFSGRHPLLARAICNSSKPGRSAGPFAETWLLEANPQWSEVHQAFAPKQVGAELIKAFQSIMEEPLEIAALRTHRWLYARHGSADSADYLWCPKNRIGVCSDWLASTGSEGAWLSANYLADKLLTSLKTVSINLQAYQDDE